MYEELIERLREFALLQEHCKKAANCDNCEKKELCDSYTHDITAVLTRRAAEAIEDLIAALAASNEVIAKSKPRWIPVTERLPENGVEVLCWYEYYHWSKEEVLPEYGIGYQYNGYWGGEVIEAFQSLTLAARSIFNGNASSIGFAAKSEKRQAYGFRWRFTDAAPEGEGGETP